MDMAHLHLVLNHFPILGLPFAALLLVIALYRKDEFLSRLSFVLFIAFFLLGTVVFLTGEPAEELVENIKGVSEHFIEEHEEAALNALLAMGITAVLSLFCLTLGRKQGVRSWGPKTVLAVAIVTTGMLIWTANLGGQVRHSEIREPTAASSNSDSSHQAEHEESH